MSSVGQRRPVERVGPAGRDRGREALFWLGLTSLFGLTVAACLSAWAVLPPLHPDWGATAVTSGSMRPTIRRGDVVVFKRSTANDHVGAGTVVVFVDDLGRQTVHRVSRVAMDGLHTRGDANTSEDSAPIADRNRRGVGRILVPLVGRVPLWWQIRDYAALATTAGLGLLACWLCRFAWSPEFDPWAAAEAAGGTSGTSIAEPLWLTSRRGESSFEVQRTAAHQPLIPPRIRAALLAPPRRQRVNPS